MTLTADLQFIKTRRIIELVWVNVVRLTWSWTGGDCRMTILFCRLMAASAILGRHVSDVGL